MNRLEFDVLSETLTRAFVTADSALYGSVMALPLCNVPRGGQECRLQGQTALQADFDLFAPAIQTAQVTDTYCNLQTIAHTDVGACRPTSLVHVFRRAHRIAEPFICDFRILPDVDGWRVAEVVATTEYIDWARGQRPLGLGDGMM